MKKLFLLLLLLIASVATGTNTWVTMADITGSAAAVQISTDCPATTPSCSATTQIDYIQIIADKSNSAVVRFGDSTVSSTVGLPIAAGGGYTTLFHLGSPYTLGNFYVYIASMDVVHVAYVYAH
jgi:hypothetical protein